MTSLALFALLALRPNRSNSTRPPVSERVPHVSAGSPVDVYVGQGEPIHPGDRYTITYKVEVLNGKALADSEKRGLPFSKELGDGHDGYFDKWVQGMSEGGKRLILTSASDPEGPPLFLSLAPASTIRITLRLVAIKRTRGS